jgi:hypothetical protein
MVKGLKLGPAT